MCYCYWKSPISSSRNYLLMSLTLIIRIVLVAHHVQLFATPWTVACQAPLSMRFPRQEYWSGLPFPSPGDLPHPGIEPGSPAYQADSLPSEPTGKPNKQHSVVKYLWSSLILEITCRKLKRESLNFQFNSVIVELLYYIIIIYIYIPYIISVWQLFEVFIF